MQTRALLLTLAFAAACGPKIPNYDYAKEPNPFKSEYVIGVSDRLQVNVWKNPELSGTVNVRPDGTITLPLVGDVKAEGRTPSALRQEVQERLKAFVNEETAVVTVSILEVNSYRFTVSGEVQRPGVYTSTHYVTIVEGVAMAGGFSRFAKKDKMLVQRRDAKGNLRQIPINYEAIESGNYENMNLVLLPGDTLLIP